MQRSICRKSATAGKENYDVQLIDISTDGCYVKSMVSFANQLVILLILVLILLVFTKSARAKEEDKWTGADTAIQTAFIALTFIDWKQTREFTGNPHKYPDMYETNPILGPHPSARKVNTIMATSIAAHTAIAFILPKPSRTIWQSIWIAIEVHCVYSNYQTGISIRF